MWVISSKRGDDEGCSPVATNFKVILHFLFVFCSCILLILVFSAIYLFILSITSLSMSNIIVINSIEACPVFCGTLDDSSSDIVSFVAALNLLSVRDPLTHLPN